MSDDDGEQCRSVASIVDARRGLTTPVLAVVVAVPLQGPSLCTSSGLIQLFSCCDYKISFGLVVGVVLHSAWSNIGDAILVVLLAELDKGR